jgi:tRNA threonylcarbamoyladenosine biosynthesis protein TsaE
MTIKLPSRSPADTRQIGETLGQQLQGDEIIFLKGELGAGKTLLTKGIAAALAIDPRDVVSPTFTLVNEFQGERQRKNGDHYRLFHVDLYRLGPAPGNSLPEIDDYIGEGVIVVEWAQYLPPSYFHLRHVIEISLQLVHLEHPGEENPDMRILEINTSLPINFSAHR